MLRSKMAIAVLAATASAVAFTGFEIPQAAAFPVAPSVPPAMTTDTNGGFQLALTQHEKWNRARHRKWVYNRHKHGQRYRHRTNVYKYYYGGYYYSRPWWTIGVPGVNIIIK